ncbi:Lrp/AsnC family transcriptional regulator [uncultured Brevundimonas sp.]|uniref:Lrp/AsnC family transcriptional regulator n=1 Tax=uncultured Brevundimonas sp. TaxID=213418 RepID=UPI0025FAB9BC|nr:Lrp/AsnC family transcriptional regulator [uncultured Brevundimonas sp.]
MDLDDFDLRLLERLQIDARTPMADLAEVVGLSAPACYRRIRRLRSIGAIEREVAVVSPKTMGWRLVMFVLVTLDREGPRTVDEVMGRLARMPEVASVSLVTGDFGFVVRLVARDMEHYGELTQRMFTDDERVKGFTTLVVRREAKITAALKASGSLP